MKFGKCSTDVVVFNNTGNRNAVLRFAQAADLLFDQSASVSNDKKTVQKLGVKPTLKNSHRCAGSFVLFRATKEHLCFVFVSSFFSHINPQIT